MAKPGDFVTHRKELLEHCLQMAKFDDRYARSAATSYEAKSEGALPGFAAEVAAAIEQQKTTPQPPRRKQ